MATYGFSGVCGKDDAAGFAIQELGMDVAVGEVEHEVVRVGR